ncbi:Bacterial extracellular solute-binding protein [Paenibacillus konkukensis]|uniref:Bacterial extracellular solute-binding protein n=1 Tax=Paenibacillus konkukensis TaxID=2020716 RepID=A0ABY4RF08_9BACL|nr:ABC transporter substrate-binding protein [Paenibacillus konkukensis]UQZ81186.1 Bacterial extracellular solute-binding protein [Paenibacillus konkukensis]
MNRFASNVLLRTLPAMLAGSLLLAGCSSGGSGDTGTKEAGEDGSGGLKPVQLSWYYPATAGVPADLKMIEDAVNQITKAKINATVKLNAVSSGDYNQKMNTSVASGEEFDILWTSNWNFDYVQNQSKGAFIALDELIDRYAPEVKKSMPDFVWEATKIDGKIYGVPNYQTVTNREGFVLQKRYLDKYNFDPAQLKKIEDIEPLLAKLKENEKDVIPFMLDRKGKFGNMLRTYNLENVINGIAVINLNNPDKIVNMYDTPEYKAYLDLMRSWYNKGYINEDAATLKNGNDYTKVGKTAVSYHNVLKPGGEQEAKVSSGGLDHVYAPLTEVYTGTNTIITTMQAISRTSKNPERAMMFINLVNTDKELFNLLSFGIEGKHYTKNADGTIKINKDAGYAAADWVFGNVFNGIPIEGKAPDIFEQTKKENESAKPSPIMGFKFKADPVAAEVANINAVVDEFGPGLNTGIVDPSKLGEFQEKLKKAGMDKVVAEAQKQLDEWKKTKK